MTATEPTAAGRTVGGPVGAVPQRSLLVDAVTGLWPGSTARPAASDPVEPIAHEFVVVPAAGGVGMAVPRRNARAAARAVNHLSAATTPGGVVKRWGLAAALRLGAGRALPGGFDLVGGDDDSLADLLATVVGEPVDCAVAIGSARVNRKRVVEFFGRSGRPLGFAKVGGTEVSDDSVAAEARALARLAQVRLDVGKAPLTVPPLLWSGEWNGSELVVLGTVPQGVRQRRMDRRDPPVPQIATLLEAFVEPSRPVRDSDWWARTRVRLDSLPDTLPDGMAGRAAACLDRMEPRTGDEVPFAAWHGDWTPWNMARHRDGLSLWDWERFDTGVPAGLDLLHYGLNARRPGNLQAHEVGPTLRSLASHWRELGERVTPDLDWASELYLAEISARYLPLLTAPGGDVLRPRAGALLSAWEKWADG